MSPLAATTALVGAKDRAKPGAAAISPSVLRIASGPVTAGIPGAWMVASVAKYDTNLSTSFTTPDHSRSFAIRVSCSCATFAVRAQPTNATTATRYANRYIQPPVCEPDCESLAFAAFEVGGKAGQQSPFLAGDAPNPEYAA